MLVFTPTDITQPWSGNSGLVEFLDVDIGPEASDRHVIVALVATSSEDLASVKVNDIALQKVVGTPTAGWQIAPQIWQGLVPHGATATIQCSANGSYITELAIAVGTITGSDDLNIAAVYTSSPQWGPSPDPHVVHESVLPNEIAVISTVVDRPADAEWKYSTCDASIQNAAGNGMLLMMSHGAQSNPGFTGASGYAATMATAIFVHGAPVESRPQPPSMETDWPADELPPDVIPPDVIPPEPVEPPTMDGVTVKEVTIATPTMIVVDVRDPPVVYGKLKQAPGPIIEGTYEVLEVKASPIDGSIRVVCSGGPFGPWYFGEGSATPLLFFGIEGVPGANGLFQGHKIDNDTIDLIDTTFSGSYSGGGRFRNFGNWIEYEGEHGYVCGQKGDHFRTQDTRSKNYVDRALLADPANWLLDGRYSPIKVYDSHTNYSQGFGVDHTMGHYGNCASLKHMYYLEFGIELTEREYTITASGIEAPFTFTSGDTAIRAIGINVNQNGYRPGDASKFATVAVHIPKGPDNGMVDLFDHGCNEFDLIDENGFTVWGPQPIVSRCGGHEAETDILGVPIDNSMGGYPDHEAMILYSSPVRKHKIIAIDGNNFVTDGPHGLSVGQMLRLHGVGGDYRGLAGCDNMTIKVITASSDRFAAANCETGSWQPFNPATYGDYQQWLDLGLFGYAHETYESNRAGTFVGSMDFSSFDRTGKFWLRILGLGKSDPIQIDDAAWHRGGKIMAEGEYAHRFGTPQDGRFGYVRPTAHMDGVTGPIYESNLPYCWSSLGAGFVGVSGQISDQLGARPPWKRTTRVPFGGSWADAGDWVQRVSGIANMVYMYCELALLCRESMSATNKGLPKSSEVLDPVLYAGTDDLPEVLHQAIFGLDTYRRCQYEDFETFPAGSTPSGLGMSSGTGCADSPAHLSYSTNYCYAPDHPSTRAYAFAAAKIGSTLKAFGHPELARVWIDSAIAADEWCETIRTAINTGASTGEWGAANDYYHDTLGGTINTGWSPQQFFDNLKAMQTNGDNWMRTNAAAALYRATGADRYRSIIETDLGMWFDPLGPLQLGAWEYHQTPGANAAQKQMVADNFVASVGRSAVSYEHFIDPEVRTPSRQLAWRNGTLFYMGGQGGDTSSFVWPMIAGHQVTGDPRFLKCLQDGIGFVFGCNVMGETLISGLGVRPPPIVFNQDTYQMGREPQRGIGAYGDYMIGQWAFAFNQWGSTSNTGTVEDPVPYAAADYIFEREIEPNRYCWPIGMARWAAHYNLGQLERSVQQTVGPTQIACDYLHGWDGNTVTS